MRVIFIKVHLLSIIAGLNCCHNQNQFNRLHSIFNILLINVLKSVENVLDFLDFVAFELRVGEELH